MTNFAERASPSHDDGALLTALKMASPFGVDRTLPRRLVRTSSRDALTSVGMIFVL
jgi:hypothetical protein